MAYCSNMLRSLTLAVLLAASVYATPTASPSAPVPRPVAMPEPSAIPELLVCVGAVGLVAWRLRKQKAS
jgi:hypothetical protein